MSLSACSFLQGAPAAQDYACGDSAGSHCYANGSLGEHVTGFRTTMTVAGNFLPGDGFVTNEFWLNNYTGSRGWIELGYKTELAGKLQYFWAVQNPSPITFTAYDIAAVPQEEIGTRVTFDIHQTGTGTFDLSVEGATTHFSQAVNVDLWSGTSGGWVSLGQELAGTKGAQASLALLVDNQVYVDGTTPRRFATQLDLPSEKVDGPPYGGWLEQPDAGNGGGVFSTHCCAP